MRKSAENPVRKSPVRISQIAQKGTPAASMPSKQEAKQKSEEMDSKEQTQWFDKGVALFHKRNFTQAMEMFEKAAKGPAPEVAHSAQMHLRMCERRLGRSQQSPQTGEDYYNYGVALMNRREMEQAEAMLRKAVGMDEKADHFHYGLALCAGLRGDVATAAKHLRRSIELQPGNRVAAKNDPEFHSIAQNPSLREILSS